MKLFIKSLHGVVFFIGQMSKLGVQKDQVLCSKNTWLIGGYDG